MEVDTDDKLCRNTTIILNTTHQHLHRYDEDPIYRYHHSNTSDSIWILEL